MNPRCMTPQERKTAAHVQRLEAVRDKQQAVLRRKTEEAEAARKRLKVAVLGCCDGSWAGAGQPVSTAYCLYAVAPCMWPAPGSNP